MKQQADETASWWNSMLAKEQVDETCWWNAYDKKANWRNRGQQKPSWWNGNYIKQQVDEITTWQNNK